MAVQPYPNPDDVCQVIGRNSLIQPLYDDKSTLIACPKHERGAIADRRAEGARTVAHAKHWSILRVAKTRSPVDPKDIESFLRDARPCHVPRPTAFN